MPTVWHFIAQKAAELDRLYCRHVTGMSQYLWGCKSTSTFETRPDFSHYFLRLILWREPSASPRAVLIYQAEHNSTHHHFLRLEKKEDKATTANQSVELKHNEHLCKRASIRSED